MFLPISASKIDVTQISRYATYEIWRIRGKWTQLTEFFFRMSGLGLEPTDPWLNPPSAEPELSQLLNRFVPTRATNPKLPRFGFWLEMSNGKIKSFFKHFRNEKDQIRMRVMNFFTTMFFAFHFSNCSLSGTRVYSNKRIKERSLTLSQL